MFVVDQHFVNSTPIEKKCLNYF